MDDCKVAIAISNPQVKLNELERLINKKQSYLAEKRKELIEKKKINTFLEGIENDYEKYFNYIQHEKLEQKRSLELLLEYLNTLSGNQRMMEEEDLLLEKNKFSVLHEIDDLKNELNNIIGEK